MHESNRKIQKREFVRTVFVLRVLIGPGLCEYLPVVRKSSDESMYVFGSYIATGW